MVAEVVPMRDDPPIEAYAAEDVPRGTQPPKETPRAPAIDWDDLSTKTPPERSWAIKHWLGMGHVTLIAGSGGTGKTSIVQAAGSCIAIARDYLGEIGLARKVLMWATEDDETELWRRQLAIAQWLNVPLSDFAGKFYAHSYDGQQVEIAATIDQRRIFPTEHYKMLCEQIGDYKAEVIILDNVARLFAGNENDRHQVTSFVALLAAAAKPTGASILLLGHPGKALGSEYSGSTAWEGAVRARWYLGYKLPADAKDDDEASAPAEDGARFLSKRKANYSPMDWRRITYQNGVMVPDEPVEANATKSVIYGKSVVARAVRKLAEMKEFGNTSTASPQYLPKLAKRFKLLEDLTEREFATAMIAMRKDGELVVQTVGAYANRSPKDGLVLP